jgi:quinol-cytochrome oxidoreductase complex cytochrome b subunit
MRQSILTLVAVLVMGSCDPPGRRAAQTQSLRPIELADFHVLYTQNCSGCHGAGGQGAIAVGIGRPVYLAIADNVTVRKTIESGIAGSAMPAFAQMNATLSRFFALHVLVIPGLLMAFAGLHLLLVLKLGINEWPMPGRIVRRSDYLEEDHDLTHTEGVLFVPYGVWKDVVFSGVILLAVIACAIWFGPFGPGGQPDPRIIETAPRPDYCL